MLQDLRVALRTFTRHPAFALAAAATFAIGIAVSTVTFSLVNALLLRPLAVRDADRLVMIAMKDRHTSLPHLASYADYKDYAGSPAFDDVFAFRPAPANLAVGDSLERIWVQQVTGNYFSALGETPLLGRALTPADDVAAGSGPVTVLSYGFWQRRFGGDRSVVGRIVRLNGRPFTIVGVTSPAFPGTSPMLVMDAYVPITMIGVLMPGHDDELLQRDAHTFRVMGHLKRGVGVAQATSAVDLIARHLGETFPDTNKDVHAVAIPELRTRPDPAAASFLPAIAAALLAMAGLVVLIACANVATLLIAHVSGRRREIAIRMAMGAGRLRILRQLVVEAALVALAGGAAAIWISRTATAWIVGLRLPTDMPIHYDLSLDWRVFGFALAVTLAAGIGAGAMTAHYASGAGADPAALKEAGRVSGSSGRNRKRDLLIAVQVAVSTVLLVCAGLFARSLQNSWRVDLGFKVDGTLLVSLDPGLQGYDRGQVDRFFDRLADRVSTIPGVRVVATARYVPFGFESSFVEIAPEDAAPGDRTRTLTVRHNVVSPHYFDVMRIPVVAGRDFTAADDAASQGVAIVNDTLARQWWPGGDAVGRRIRLAGTPPQDLAVVGVVRTVKWTTLNEEPRPFVYVPFAQQYASTRTLHVLASGDPAALVPAIQREVSVLDRTMPTYNAVTLAAQVYQGQALLPARLGAVLVGAFGVFGLLLATAGLYGVVSRVTNERQQEIGVRLAIGATTGDVLRLVVGNAMSVVAVGLAAGAALALAVTRLLSNMLYGVAPTDPITYLGVAAVVALVALAASGTPALRATRLDPVGILRGD